jgi:hypothetical protein
MGKFSPRDVSDTGYGENCKGWPAIVEESSAPSSPVIHPFAVARFLENHLSIIEAFLKAGVDPTNTLGYLPNDFTLCKGALKETVEEAVAEAAETFPDLDVGDIFMILSIAKKFPRKEVGIPEVQEDEGEEDGIFGRGKIYLISRNL